MNTSIVIQFNSVVAVIHVICVAVQIGILFYISKKSNKQTYNNSTQGGYQR
jgi:hypothetical protein